VTAWSTPISVGALGCRPEGGYLRGMHINWGVPLRWLQFWRVISGGGGVISGGLSPAFLIDVPMTWIKIRMPDPRYETASLRRVTRVFLVHAGARSRSTTVWGHRADSQWRVCGRTTISVVRGVNERTTVAEHAHCRGPVYTVRERHSWRADRRLMTPADEWFRRTLTQRTRETNGCCSAVKVN